MDWIYWISIWMDRQSQSEQYWCRPSRHRIIEAYVREFPLAVVKKLLIGVATAGLDRKGIP
ncbi:hypothetical protein SAMN05216420_11318 [Nitrosospira sp. Nl5]|nr:hypothetical protein SAMN05216420_11318 [Nitrosospira sp. Nl5]